jgi:hypothetical protein
MTLRAGSAEIDAATVRDDLASSTIIFIPLKKRRRFL